MSNRFEGHKFCLLVYVRKEEVATGQIWRAYCESQFLPAHSGVSEMARSTIFQIKSIPPAYYHDVLSNALEYATLHNAIFEGLRN